MGPGSVMNAISRMSPPQAGHSSGNSSPTRAMSFAQAIREVSCERGFAVVSEQTPVPVLPRRRDQIREPVEELGAA
jgi:molybdopterin biosynthesis enzyme MoaB